jgi:hypothetical protein
MAYSAEIAYRPHQEAQPVGLTIAQDIQKVRDAFLQNPRDSEKATLTYDPWMDIALFRTVDKYRASGLEAYYETKKTLREYTNDQVDTMFGELCNVAQSTYKLTIKDGRLFNESYNGFFLDMVKRGRDYRKKQGSNATDREDAEVTGVENIIQPVLTHKDAPENFSVVSFSPPRPGSIYTKNFYDVYTVRGKGKDRFIEVTRFTSGLDRSEYVEKIKQMGIANKIPDNATDVDFLSNPVLLPPFSEYSNPDSLHAFMHKGHSFMTRKVFEKQILRAMQPLKTDYLNALENQPYNVDLIGKKFDAMLNAIAEAKRRISIGSAKLTTSIDEKILFTAKDIVRFENQEVQQVMSGCGVSSGFKKDFSIKNPLQDVIKNILKGLKPHSVADFGQEWFNCPKCKYKADGPVGNKCPGCNLTKEAYAEETGVVCD